MKQLFVKVFLVSILASSLFADEYIGTYYAKLAKVDHYNSHGTRLSKVASIIRQDRFNFHVRGIRQKEDTYDPFFMFKENRATLERMLQRGYISSSASRSIINGTPIIKVKVFRQHINVEIIEDNIPISSVN